MIYTGLKDGVEGSVPAQVLSDHSQLVTLAPYPPFIEQKIVPFRQFLTDDGTSSGSTDMLVAGSAAAPLDFYVETHAERDRYITTLSFVLSDTGNFEQNEFANTGSALSNGCQLFYDHERFGRIDLHDAIVTNFDLTRLGFAEPAFGQTGNTFRVTNAVGTGESMLPFVDLRRIMPPFGIKLDKGMDQRLTFRIRDDLSSGIVAFNCIAYGFDRVT